jgi:hypothetical protein
MNDYFSESEKAFIYPFHLSNTDDSGNIYTYHEELAEKIKDENIINKFASMDLY